MGDGVLGERGPPAMPLVLQVFKNLKLFMQNKDPGDDLFDRLTVSWGVGGGQAVPSDHLGLAQVVSPPEPRLGSGFALSHVSAVQIDHLFSCLPMGFQDPQASFFPPRAMIRAWVWPASPTAVPLNAS